MAYEIPALGTAGQVYTAAAHNIIVGDILQFAPFVQGVFTTETLRDAAIPSPTEGMHVYITAPESGKTTAVGGVTTIPLGIRTIYNGSVWVCVTPVGSRTSGTSGTFQTSYGDWTVSAALTSVTLVTGVTALVSVGARITGTGNFGVVSVKTGTVAADDSWGAFNQSATYLTVGRTFVMSGLDAGTNTFTIQHKTNATGGNGDQATLVVCGIA